MSSPARRDSSWAYSGNNARLSAIDEAIRILRPGGHIVIADLGFTHLCAIRVTQRGMADVMRQNHGWRARWGLPLSPTHAVTAIGAAPRASWNVVGGIAKW